MPDPILQVHSLQKHFPVAPSLFDRLSRRPPAVVRAVDGVSFELQRGEVLALVGESGSGKTTVGMNVLALQEPTAGRIVFEGHDVVAWAKGKLSMETGPSDDLGARSARAQILELRRRGQMIFQDPYESLNPRQTVYEIVSEPLEIHRLAAAARTGGQTSGKRSEPADSAEAKRERTRAALEACGLAPAEHFWNRYPGELSGGQRQRVVIAGALVLEPDLLVADEPVSMLDVSIRAEILGLLDELRQQRGISILYTTHDLATAGYFTDRMAVMYLGRIVELGPTAEVLRAPQHPYTRALVSVAPAPNPRRRKQRVILQGEVPNPIAIPPGCRFHPRCPVAIASCKEVDPPDVQVGAGHQAACLLLEGAARESSMPPI